MAAPEQQTVVQATPNIANDMSELIGRTPMVYLNRVTAGNVAKVGQTYGTRRWRWPTASSLPGVSKVALCSCCGKR